MYWRDIIFSKSSFSLSVCAFLLCLLAEITSWPLLNLAFFLGLLKLHFCIYYSHCGVWLVWFNSTRRAAHAERKSLFTKSKIAQAPLWITDAMIVATTGHNRRTRAFVDRFTKVAIYVQKSSLFVSLFSKYSWSTVFLLYNHH